MVLDGNARNDAVFTLMYAEIKPSATMLETPNKNSMKGQKASSDSNDPAFPHPMQNAV